MSSRPRITYRVERVGREGEGLAWRPRSRAAALEMARDKSARFRGRFSAWAFHLVKAGALSYRHGELLGVFEGGEPWKDDARLCAGCGDPIDPSMTGNHCESCAFDPLEAGGGGPCERCGHEQEPWRFSASCQGCLWDEAAAREVT